MYYANEYLVMGRHDDLMRAAAQSASGCPVPAVARPATSPRRGN